MTDKRRLKGETTRANILSTATALFQKQGYSATGLNQIIAESGQPRGSIYFHFPGGKQEIASISIDQSAEVLSHLIKQVFEAANSPIQCLGMICQSFSNQLKASNFEQGCPISPLTVSAGEEATALRELCAIAYDRWQMAIQKGLSEMGISETDAIKNASLILSSVEGAILLSQARHNTAALDSLPDALAQIF